MHMEAEEGEGGNNDNLYFQIPQLGGIFQKKTLPSKPLIPD